MKTSISVWELKIDGRRSVYDDKLTADRMASEALFGAKKRPKIELKRIYLHSDGTWR